MHVKEYTVDIGGVPHTLRLSDEDADRLGVSAPADKPDEDAPVKARRSVRDKARTTAEHK